jgi:Fe-S-cluster containining protein
MISSLKLYDELLLKVDAFTNRVTSRYMDHISCREGCAECCILESVNSIEAFHILKGLAGMPEGKKRIVTENMSTTPDGNPCLFLQDDACLIYGNRPIICRTHGFPLLVDGRVAFCPKNFSELTHVDPEFVLNLENLNTMLAAVNIRFLSETGIVFFQRDRIILREIFHRPVTDILAELRSLE